MQKERKRHGVRCPECGGETKIVDSSPTDDDATRRRRVCRSCGHRFVTLEYDAEYIRMLEGGQ